MMGAMSADLTLAAIPMSREAFAPYGQLVMCPGRGESRPVNEDTAERWDDQAPCANLRAAATLNVATFQARPRPLPFMLVTLERHPHSTQIFLPLHASRYVVVVADGAEAVPGALRAFLVAGDVGVAYAPNVWHHTLIVLDAPASFACFVFEDGTVSDCEVAALDPSEQRSLVVG